MEADKIFLSGLFAGLRRAEIDGLEWSSIDWETGAIRVDYTDVLHVKSEGSSGIVEVDAEVLDELRALIASKHGIFAAAHVLRHSDISTTSRHYADQKQRVTAGLGHFLRTEIKVAETA